MDEVKKPINKSIILSRTMHTGRI